MNNHFARELGLVAMFLCVAGAPARSAEPDGGALDGQRYRVVVSTDLKKPSGEEDDVQSLANFLLNADLFDVEGLITSPPAGEYQSLLHAIDVYAEDYPNLKTWSKDYPAPDYLRSVAKAGATSVSPEDAGFSEPTDGSRHLVERAHQEDDRPLWVLVWGSITDVAQALHDDPAIAPKLRVYFIASWNRRKDPAALEYIQEDFPELWIIQSDRTFSGHYRGGNQDGPYHPETFVDRHVRGHGALGEYYASARGHGFDRGWHKEGDTPSFHYLMTGDADDPTTPSWGGSYRPHPASDRFPNWFVDHEQKVDVQPLVNRWREEFLDHLKDRMDRAKTPKK